MQIFGGIHHVEVPPILDFRLIYITFTHSTFPIFIVPKSPKREGLVGARLSTNVRASFVFVMMYTIQKRIRCDVDGSIDSKVHPSTIDANHRGMNTHARPAILPEMARWSLEKQKHHQGAENAFRHGSLDLGTQFLIKSGGIPNCYGNLLEISVNDI